LTIDRKISRIQFLNGVAAPARSFDPRASIEVRPEFSARILQITTK
jgi:hypothetical protein